MGGDGSRRRPLTVDSETSSDEEEPSPKSRRVDDSNESSPLRDVTNTSRVQSPSLLRLYRSTILGVPINHPRAPLANAQGSLQPLTLEQAYKQVDNLLKNDSSIAMMLSTFKTQVTNLNASHPNRKKLKELENIITIWQSHLTYNGTTNADGFNAADLASRLIRRHATFNASSNLNQRQRAVERRAREANRSKTQSYTDFTREELGDKVYIKTIQACQNLLAHNPVDLSGAIHNFIRALELNVAPKRVFIVLQSTSTSTSTNANRNDSAQLANVSANLDNSNVTAIKSHLRIVVLYSALLVI